MTINLEEFCFLSLSMDEVSQIVDSLEHSKFNVIYKYGNQVANAKSLINLLAIDICNKPHGTFEFSNNESPKLIKYFNNLLNSFKK